jgi:uncharacterized protein YbaR (Trm112 family)
MNCPGCSAAMSTLALEGHVGAAIDIDICAGCQVFWFDRRESLQLSPRSTLKLFERIGEQAASRTSSLPDVLRCPRCQSRLVLTNDRQRNTPFRYWRCTLDHGRLTTWFDFLREKHFVKPLSAQQLAELRQHVQMINCSNCGGPIDLTTHSSCSHCSSPISMLDLKQAGQVIAELQAAAAPKAIDPALPIELARARREVDAAFASIEGHPTWWKDAAGTGIVEAGLGAVAR